MHTIFVLSIWSDIAYRFVDLRESDEVEATVNYEQDNTLEVNLREDVAEGGREGARGDDEEEKGEEGDLERKKRKRKLEDMVCNGVFCQSTISSV